jgi:hypothetical protein
MVVRFRVDVWNSTQRSQRRTNRSKSSWAVHDAVFPSGRPGNERVKSRS